MFTRFCYPDARKDIYAHHFSTILVMNFCFKPLPEPVLSEIEIERVG